MTATDPHPGTEDPPLEPLLRIARDFPELVRTALDVLADDRYPRAQAEQTVRALIRSEATWLNSRRSRWAA